MIPAAFKNYGSTDMAGVIALLHEHGDDARVTAGGHSLIPKINLRMAQVPHLIDLQAIESLDGISVTGGSIKIGAAVTQHDIIKSAEIGNEAPILEKAAL